MKNFIVLTVTAMLLAGCSAAVQSAPSAPSTPSASVITAGGSVASLATPMASDSKTGDTTTAASATAASKLTLAETCTKFISISVANAPAQGSKDNQAYWTKMRDELRPVRDGAAPEAKSFMDGLFNYYNTGADNWDPAQTPARTKAAEPYFAESSKVCAGYFGKR